ncbi:MAG: sigma-70 family RNA polymerase sigma factor [Pseudomonadota bacterium]
MTTLDYSTLPNEDLYQLCLRGDDTAWRYLYNYVLKITRSKQWQLRVDPEDMAQGIICHLLSGAINKLKDHGAFRAFVRTVSRNKILDSFKKKQIPVTSYNSDNAPVEQIFFDPSSEHSSPEHVLIGNCAADRITNTLKALSDKCQTVLDAYIDYQLGLVENYQVLAKKLGEPVGTISSRINRCLKTLKEYLEIETIQQ